MTLERISSKLLQVASQVVELANQAEIDQTEVSVSAADGFSVTARNGALETVEHHLAKEVTVTVYHKQRTATTSSSDLSPAAVAVAVNKACSAVQYIHADQCVGLADHDKLAHEYPDLDLFHRWGITIAEAAQLAIECETIALAEDARVTKSEGANVNTINNLHVYANSLDFVGHYITSEHSINCSVLAEQSGDMQRDYEYSVACSPEDLTNVALIAKQAAQKAVHRLGGVKIATRECPVIFSAPLAKGLISSLVAAISGTNLYRKSSFLLEHLNKPIFPKFINIYQQPHRLRGLGSAPFDSEGVRTHDRHYVTQGVLTSYVLSSYSARRLGMDTTGNAGGVYNLTIDHSGMNLKQMLKEMGTGLFVTELMGSGVNMVTGDYSRGAAGYWVEHGEIQYPVEEITIAGNLRDMFQGIVAVANDEDTRGNIRTGSIWINRMMVAGG